MNVRLPLINDDEMARLGRAEDQAGFGALETEEGHLPLKAMDVRAKVAGLVYHTTLRQTFVNQSDTPLEATYIFPLPARAAVTSFRLKVKDRLVQGVLKERGEARREYVEAIAAGHRAAITEEERPNVFTLRVGNLMPGEDAEVRLTLTGRLPYCDGEATFRFPLVVAPRYIPGDALEGESVGDGVAVDTDAVPDASRITPPVLLPGYPNPVRLSIAVDVDPAGLPLSNLRSSLHAVTTRSDESTGRQEVTLGPNERLDRDFILRFQLGEEAVQTSLVLHPDGKQPKQDGDDEGTFLLTLTPPVDLSREQRPRDVVFILDRSGSMGGWKMVAARRAMARMIDTLRDDDAFALYAFDHHIETPEASAGEAGMALVRASDRNRYRAIEFLAKLEARGGTEMAGPLNLAAEQLAGGYQDRDRILVLVTDGQVGNERQIVRELGQRIRNVRVFCLGIDRAVNLSFLRRLAALGGGSAEQVESEDRLDDVMDRIHRRIATPVLTELALRPKGLEIVDGSVVPDRLPDLFAGNALTVLGRYTGTPQGSVRLQATDASGRSWSETIAATASENPAISAIWARRQVRKLEDLYILGRQGKSKLEQQIVDTSLRFGVLCRFTAFVAVDRDEIVNQGTDLHRVTQAVEVPSGWAGQFKSPPVDASYRAMTRTGVLPQALSPAKTMAVDTSMLGAPPPPPQAPYAQAPAPPAASSPKGGRGPSPGSSFADGAARAFRSVKEAARRLTSAGKKKAPPKRRHEPSPPTESPADDTLDLSAYQHRAKALQRKLEEASVDLGAFALQLEALVEDLESVGCPKHLVEPLDAARQALSEALDGGDSEAVDEAQRACADALRDFIEDKPRGGGKRSREDFWK